MFSLPPLFLTKTRFFLSIFWHELFCLQGTKLVQSIAFHPQTDGHSEIVNKPLETYLRCFINGRPKIWSSWVHWTEFCYNTSPYSSILMSHFPSLLQQTTTPLGLTTIDSLTHRIQEGDIMLNEIQFNLVKPQQAMKHVDRKSQEVSFQVGDYVPQATSISTKLQQMRTNEKVALAIMVLTKFYKKSERLLTNWSFYSVLQFIQYFMFPNLNQLTGLMNRHICHPRQLTWSSTCYQRIQQLSDSITPRSVKCLFLGRVPLHTKPLGSIMQH